MPQVQVVSRPTLIMPAEYTCDEGFKLAVPFRPRQWIGEGYGIQYDEDSSDQLDINQILCKIASLYASI